MKIVPGDSTHRYQRHEHWHRLKQTTGTQKRWPISLPRYFKSMAMSSSLLSLTLLFSTSRSHQFSLIQAASPTKNLWRGSRPWGARAARRCRGGACELAAAAAAEGRASRPPAPTLRVCGAGREPAVGDRHVLRCLEAGSGGRTRRGASRAAASSAPTPPCRRRCRPAAPRRRVADPLVPSVSSRCRASTSGGSVSSL